MYNVYCTNGLAVSIILATHWPLHTVLNGMQYWRLYCGHHIFEKIQTTEKGHTNHNRKIIMHPFSSFSSCDRCCRKLLDFKQKTKNNICCNTYLSLWCMRACAYGSVGHPFNILTIGHFKHKHFSCAKIKMN